MPPDELVDDLIPITRTVRDLSLMRRLPGVISQNGEHSSSRKKAKELTLVYAMTGVAPHIKKHISGMQQIRIQATQFNSDTQATNATAPTYSSQYFSLANNVPNYAAYTALFDEYMIEKVEIWISPSMSQLTSASTVLGDWSTAVDYDDANTPSSLGTVTDKQNSASSTILQAHYHQFEPKFAIGTYSGSFVSFASDRGWVDCASPNVQHYGIKVACTSTPGGVEYLNSTIRITVAFRSPGIS
jgi:hypothetical protein